MYIMILQVLSERIQPSAGEEFIPFEKWNMTHSSYFQVYVKFKKKRSLKSYES